MVKTEQTGLYDATNEHDACGVGMVVNIHGNKSHELVDSALKVLENMRIIRKSKFPQNPKRSVRFSGKRTKRSVQKRKARNTQKAETKVL